MTHPTLILHTHTLIHRHSSSYLHSRHTQTHTVSLSLSRRTNSHSISLDTRSLSTHTHAHVYPKIRSHRSKGLRSRHPQYTRHTTPPSIIILGHPPPCVNTYSSYLTAHIRSTRSQMSVTQPEDAATPGQARPYFSPWATSIAANTAGISADIFRHG